MGKTKTESGKSQSDSERLSALKTAIDAFRTTPTDRTISAMPVVIDYTAMIGRVILRKHDDEHLFDITLTKEDKGLDTEWTEKRLDAFVVRDEFLKVKTIGEAFDFLSATGRFTPLSNSVTWADFQRWQRFASLVQEHNDLAAAMERGERSGELAETLKALSGIYPTALFEPTRVSESELQELTTLHPESRSWIKNSEQSMNHKRREFLKCFREPRPQACAIRWIPKDGPPSKELIRKLSRGGAMIEYLVPREDLQPVVLISPQTTLEAIAAAIYADRIHGVEYRTCIACRELFRIGAHKNKKYCDRERCKNTANQRRIRANRLQKAAVPNRGKRSKGEHHGTV